MQMDVEHTCRCQDKTTAFPPVLWYGEPGIGQDARTL